MSRTVAVTMVRDEEDIIGATVRHMLHEVDAVLVADNRSIDGTREVLRTIEEEHPGRVLVVDDPDPAYRQSAKMTALASRARTELGAEWIVPFDADEWWYSPFGRIADVLAELAPWSIVPAPLFDHMATSLDVVTEADPTRRLGWRRTEPNPLHKVACRWRVDLTIAQGNHDAHYITPIGRFDPVLVVRHFPYRSAEHFVRKARNGAEAYRAAGDSISADLGAHWRQWGDLLDGHGPEVLAEVYRVWYFREDPTGCSLANGEPAAPLIFDPVVHP